MMIKRTALLLCLALLATACVIPASAETRYIFPDSNKRLLTWEEVEAWNNEALNIGFNEIWARHGYKFNPGGACERWFSRQDWYKPITSGDNQHNVLPKASKLEWDNYHLIKDVMAYKRAYNKENEGKRLPTPPAAIELLSGFERVNLRTGQTLPVYSAPSASSWRGANGRASVSTGGSVYAYGTENGWMMGMYKVTSSISANAVRVGWIDLSKVAGSVDLPAPIVFNSTTMTIQYPINVTDDPMAMPSITTLSEGTQVTWLGTFYSASHMWDYIEFNLRGQRARGFVLSGVLQTEVTATDDWNNE